MNILFVDDVPGIKVQPAIQYLKREEFDFNYEIVRSVDSALNYINEHFSEIDLAVVDLGLPKVDDGYEYGKLLGLVVIEEILKRNTNIPIVINSTTKIPDEEEYLKKQRKDNTIIEHVNKLDGQWLIEFIESSLLKHNL